MAILGLSLALILQILGAARERLLRAERRWGRRHLAEQACEFYLLAGPLENTPSGLFPEGYRSEATLSFDLDETLPQDADIPINGWRLARLNVQVFDERGKTVVTQNIEKLVREDDEQ